MKIRIVRTQSQELKQDLESRFGKDLTLLETTPTAYLVAGLGLHISTGTQITTTSFWKDIEADAPDYFDNIEEMASFQALTEILKRHEDEISNSQACAVLAWVAGICKKKEEGEESIQEVVDRFSRFKKTDLVD